MIVNARLQFLLFFAVIIPKNVCKKKKNVLKYLQVSSLIGVSPTFPGLTPNFLFFRRYTKTQCNKHRNANRKTAWACKRSPRFSFRCSTNLPPYRARFCCAAYTNKQKCSKRPRTMRKIMRPIYNISAASSFSSCSAKLSRRFLSVSESFLYISSTRFAPSAAFFFFAPYAFFSLSEASSRSLPFKR